MTKDTRARLRPTTLKKIKSYKITPRESYDEIINRILVNFDKLKNTEGEKR